MNKSSNLWPLLLLVLCVLVLSCDRIDDPRPLASDFDLTLFPGEEEDYPFPVFETSTNTVKNVLLEDFTGHKCVPCFAAAQLAKDIEDANAPRVIVASIHASSTGNFQSVDDEHPTDFTTEAGDEYVAEIEGGGDNPLGTTNRILDTQTYGVPRVWQVSPFWEGNVVSQLASDLHIDIQVEVNYYAETDGLFVHSRVDFLEDKEGQFNLIHYLIRKEVESPQSIPGGMVLEEYIHHNVVSQNLTGTWGQLIASETTAAGTNVELQTSHQLPAPNTDSTYASNNLAIISLVLNRETYLIEQVVITDID